MASNTQRNSKRDSWWTNSGNYRTYAGGVISPWENGVIPGTESSVYNQNLLAQQAANSYLVNSLVNQGNVGGMSNGVGHGTEASLLRQYELMRGMDNRNVSNHVSSSTNASLLGPVPIPSLFDVPQSNVREIDFQRVGNSWAQSQLSEYYRRLYMGDIPLRRAPEIPQPKKPKKAKKKKIDSEAKDKQEKKSPPSSESSKATEEKTCDENGGIKGDNENKEDKDKKVKNKSKKGKKGNSPCPVEALMCYMCEIYSFKSIWSYQAHLKGTTHMKIADALYHKKIALKELLQWSSKLHELRKEDKILRETGENTTNMRIESTEKKLYRETCRKACYYCNVGYKNIANANKHRLSLQHLKNMYNIAQKRAANASGGKAERVEEVQRRMMKKEEGDLNNEDLEESSDKECPSDAVVHDLMLLRKGRLKAQDDFVPFYDPGEMRGLNFITEKLSFYCNVCEKEVSTLHHCRSFSHYENMLSWSNKVREEKTKPKVLKKTIFEGVESLSLEPAKEKGETDAEDVAGKALEGKYVFMEGVINKDKGVTSESPSHSSSDSSTANQVDAEDNVQSSSLKEDPKRESEDKTKLNREEEVEEEEEEDEDDDDDDDDDSEEDFSEAETFSDNDDL